MKRNRTVKGKGVAARQGLKEAGDETWTGRTETGYKAGGAGKAAMDAHSRYFIRSPGGRSGLHQEKAARLILRDLHVCPRGYARREAGRWACRSQQRP